jgi:hypothetical protein
MWNLGLGVVTALYCYNKSELDDEKKDCDINDVVEKDGNNEPINQTTGPMFLNLKKLVGLVI